MKTPGTPLTQTLARLSFWVPPGRMAEFEVAYREKVVPILKAHGLVESSERGRATVENVFSRLFECKTPKEVLEKQQALRGDPAWQEVLRDLGTTYGTARPDIAGPYGVMGHSFTTSGIAEPNVLAKHSFNVYFAPAGFGKVVPAGPGKQVLAGRGRGRWRTYDVADGIPSTLIYAIFQDREGYLWFGTYGSGVSRYDGRTFTTFTTREGLAHNTVSSIIQDREGNLWFGTGGIDTVDGGGVSRYDGTTFISLTTREGLADNRVSSILQDREGNFWFGTPWGGVSRYNGKTFTTFTTQDGLANNVVYAIVQDREGDLWFGTQDGVSRYNGKTFVTYTTKDGLAHNRVLVIFQDGAGHLWFGTNGGVSRYDGQVFQTMTRQDGLAGNAVQSIFQDGAGHLWFGTWPGGASRYDPSTSSGQGREGKRFSEPLGMGTFTTFTIQDGLAWNYIHAICHDREGHLWFGTRGQGVSRYDGQTFTTYTVEDGLPHNEVNAAFQDREGNLWFGTWGGVSRYDGKTFTTFAHEDNLPVPSNRIGPFLQDREGNLWFGTFGGGVCRYDGQTFAAITVDEGLIDPLSRVLSIFQDREGTLWFGTYRGVTRYDGKTLTNFGPEDGLGSWVWTIFQDREGVLWFGTMYGGASRYDGKAFKTFTTRDGLPSNAVTSIFQDRDGDLWFGTWCGGVSRYDGKLFISITQEMGLANKAVMAIFQDRQGHLWFTVEGGGFIRYDGQVFQAMLQSDGLASNLFTLTCSGMQTILQDQQGRFWFSTIKGVTCYRPPPPYPPPVFVDAVVADRRYEGVSELSIPSTAEVTAFEFHGMSFKTRPDGMVYRYRLMGHDQDWKNTRERRVEYQDLPPGDYTFEVLAVDRDLVYSEQPATVKVTIVPDPRIEALTEALSGGGKLGEFVGTSQALRRAQAQLSEVAWTDVTVLILGETGTGKGLAARAVHALSGRRSGPFIQVNCGAIPEGLVESELFGHEKGAFTGAVSRKLGKVEVAEEGTLFLDEIGDMPLEAQVKLLRFLEERTFERVGGTQTLCADARVIAATNRDLRQMVSEGKFREDLYFRLQAFPVRLPPLRERREDIPLLAEYFMRRMASHLNKPVSHLTPEALALLSAYAWPGNVRELEHAVQRAVIVCRGPVIRAGDIFLEFAKERGSSTEEIATLEENERRHILEILERTGGVIKGPHGAAALLGLHPSTLYSRMKRLGIGRT